LSNIPSSLREDDLVLSVRLTPKSARDEIGGSDHLADGRTVLKVRLRALVWQTAGHRRSKLHARLAGFTEKQTSDLAKKLDKDNPDLMSAPPDQLRQRIADLARGTAEPVFKNILEYTSMKVTRTKTPKPK
jgi:uncharacterized protein